MSAGRSLHRLVVTLALLGLSGARVVYGQAAANQWQAPPTQIPGAASAAPPATRSATATAVQGGSLRDDVLPRTHGQIWRKYDLTPYTSRVTTTERPEQAVVDWILRETGTEVWFSEPLGLLNANKSTLSVYHTPEMQEIVSAIVDRFVSSQAESYVFSLRLLTIGSPNWRSNAFPLLRPVPVQTPGLEAWLVSKENAAVLLANLARRTDFREHGSSNLVLHNGQAQAVSKYQPQSFVRRVRRTDENSLNYDLEMGQIQQGYSLEISPLLSIDQRYVDAAIKCHIDQVERLLGVWLDVPTAFGQTQRVEIQVPQVVSWRLHERFRWPVDQTLLLSCGVVATPSPDQPTMLGIPNPFGSGSGRADALVLIDSRGKPGQALVDGTQPGMAETPNYRGRY